MKLVLPLLLLFAASLAGDDFQDLSARARTARESNDVPRAIALYRQALDLNPQWQEGWWFLASLLYDTDQYAPSRDAFQHLVNLSPDAAPGWAFLGLCEFETGDYKKARSDIERGLSLGADKEPQLGSVLLYHQALLLTHEGQFDEALQKYAGLVRGAQGKAVEAVLTGLGLAALHVPLLPADIPSGEKDLYLMAGRTASLVLTGDYAQADSAFGELLQRYKNAPHVHYMYGVYLLARDPEEAFKEFGRELEILPSNAAAAAMLAWGLLTRGDSDAALPYAKQAAQRPQAAPFDKYLYGRALVETGDVRGGLSYLKDAETADPNNMDVHVTLAAAYSRLGQPQKAREERELAMQMEGKSRPLVQP